MSVASWTAYGMDWTNEMSMSGGALITYFEALRQAIAERLVAVENAKRLTNGATTPFTRDDLASSSYYGGLFGPNVQLENQLQYSVCQKMQAAVSALLLSGFVDTDNLPVEESVYAGYAYSALPRLTESLALSKIKANTRIAANFLQPVAPWLLQQYKLLNLMNTLQTTPATSSPSGGERYKVIEITPWEEDMGSWSNLALGWAELTYFDLSEFDANGWNYIYPISGRGGALSAADNMDYFERKHSYCAFSRWLFNLGLLVAGGHSFEVSGVQLKASLPTGCGQTTPILTNEFVGDNMFKRVGYSSFVPETSALSSGILTVDIGTECVAPDVPDYPSEMGTCMKGWKMESMGPVLVKFGFNYTT